MASEDFVKSTIEQLQGSNKTFAEFISEVFKDKFIEIYTGDTYEETKTEQITTSYPSVFCGKVVGAYKECLVLSCVFAAGLNKNRTLKLGNLMFVNERSIVALNEVDGNGIIADMFLESKDTLTIKSAFVDKK